MSDPRSAETRGHERGQDRGERDSFAWNRDEAEWVPVGAAWGLRKEVDILQSVLLDAGIPCCLSQRPYGLNLAWQGWWGSEHPIRILVPPSRLEEARALLDTPPEPDGDDDPQAELESLRRGDWRWKTARVLIWLYLAGIAAFFASALVSEVRRFVGLLGR